ncbi:MAG TPA: AmmeMemoRadiSam system protein B [Bryobacteraceae bacterium]|nr:AmmeMemoRadiSam system protein B [Bryobacteraceae bacterium]
MLPRLRGNLDFFPSPIEEKPGLMIRDPFHYSDAVLIIPPALVACLEFFDGERGELDLREFLVRLTGDLEIGELQRHLTDTLSSAGFLEDENFAARKEHAHRSFAEAAVREPVHAGSGYPNEPEALRETIRGYLNGALPENGAGEGRVIAIAAPHVSPFGGVEAYRAAYSALAPEDRERTFVILGTSHYGAPDRLGLTRKPFRTPFGETQTDGAMVEELAKQLGGGALMEDYCHAVEHSIEFQVVFLQHLFGPSIRVVPLLCGPFLSVYRGGFPEDSAPVGRIFGALGELAARDGDRLLWVLGVDMAHMGRRYGDDLQARAGMDEMDRVEQRDRDRIAQISAGDARGFWERVRENQDDLKWCGSAPIYTFLKALPHARGTLRRYQQWNIDEHSVVSFAGMSFSLR